MVPDNFLADLIKDFIRQIQDWSRYERLGRPRRCRLGERKTPAGCLKILLNPGLGALR